MFPTITTEQCKHAVRCTQEPPLLERISEASEKKKKISTVKHAIRPYFISRVRQTCSESRCLEEREVPEIQEEEEEAEVGVGEGEEGCGC